MSENLTPNAVVEPAPAASLPPRPPRTKVVLIVDDDQDIRTLLAYNVAKAGFRTMTAVDAADAAAKLEEEAPDMILLDLMLPGRNGYEFLRDLQASSHREIPVSIVTARWLDSSTVTMLTQESNVVDFFIKPFDVSRLVGSLRRHLLREN